MYTKNIGTILFISALLALAVFVAPVAAAGTSFSQLNSFSRLNGLSDGSDTVPFIPDTSGVPDDILPADPIYARTFSPMSHNLGTFTIDAFSSSKTAAQFARTVGPHIRGMCH